MTRSGQSETSTPASPTRTGHEFIVVWTGYQQNEDGDREWVHHILCPGCQYRDVAYCYEDAQELRMHHRRTAKALDLPVATQRPKAKPDRTPKLKKPHEERLVY